jgi:GT2 family glycosyltransferase
MKQSANVNFDVYLVDDGSKDGTADAVHQSFPSVQVIEGDGQLYWGGGMRLALEAAMARDYDFYLWLNDDTVLAAEALDVLVSSHESVVAGEGSPAVVVGTSVDPLTRQPVYGGWLMRRTRARLRFDLIQPSLSEVPCDTMNGNVVLIDRATSQLVGNIDRAFPHSRGDFDYGLRASRLGVQIVVAPGAVACCPRNSPRGTWRDSSLPRRQRWRLVREKKGLPVHEWRVFTQRHGGRLWMVTWIGPYIRLLLPRWPRPPGGLGIH